MSSCSSLFSSAESKKDKETNSVLEGDQLVIKANAEKNKGNIDRALELYNKALKKGGSKAAIHYEIAQLLYQSKQDYDGALKHINLSIAEDESNKWYLIFYIKINEENGRPELVENGFRQLIKAYPDMTEYVIDFADFYISMQSYEKAIELYKSVEEKLGVTEAINKNIFLLHKGLKNDELAIEELNKIIAAFPTNEKYYMELVDMYRLTDNKEMVAKTYERALDKMPDNSAVKDEYAHHCFLEHKIDSAFNYQMEVIKDPHYEIGYKIEIVTLYRKYEKYDSTLSGKRLALQQELLTIHPEDFHVNKYIGELHYRNENWDSARVHFKKALKSRSNSFGTWQILIICDNELEDYDAMIKDAEQAITFFPAQSELHYYLGIGKTQLKKDDEAVEHFEMGLGLATQQTQKVRFYTALGDSYYLIGNKEASFENYEEALKLDSLNALVLNNDAYYLSENDMDLKKAEDMSSMSNILAPGTASFNDTYGWILYKMEKYDRALEWLLKAESNGGNDNAIIMEHIGDAYYAMKQFDKATLYWKNAIKYGGEKNQLQQKIDQI